MKANCRLFSRAGVCELTVSPRQKSRVKPARKRRRKSCDRSKKIAAEREAAPNNQALVRTSAGEWFEKLVALQTQLRAPGGCPWDREQTHESLRRFLIEETYEVLDAMEAGSSREFASELGDLLLQVVFHSVLAEEAGRFTIADVIESIHTKMVRRHPHVFGNATAATSGEVLKNWEQIKAEERAAEGKGSPGKDSEESLLGGIPRSLPATLEAYQMTRRAAHIGFDWDNLEGIFEKIDEEKRELLHARTARKPAVEKQNAGTSRNKQPVPMSSPDHARIEEETGDLLFAAVNVARFLGVDPEIALKKANRKFRKRFNFMEAAAKHEKRRLADLPRERMEGLWNEAKSARAKAADDAE
jgi:MazG family protein